MRRFKNGKVEFDSDDIKAAFAQLTPVDEWWDDYLANRPPHDRNPDTPQEGLACEGEFCIYHNPSDHHMNTWRISRGGERQCPHGIGHPDPDYLAWLDRVKPGHAGGVHGCDGCCRKPEATA